jgi:hypothetical protein
MEGRQQKLIKNQIMGIEKKIESKPKTPMKTSMKQLQIWH